MGTPIPNGNLGCLNCHKSVANGEAKTFLSVFVCSECHEYASHFRDSLMKQLKWLTVMADDAIREALTKGELHPGTPQQNQDVPKSELILELRRLVEVQSVSKSSADSVNAGASALPAPLTSGAIRNDNREGVGEKES